MSPFPETRLSLLARVRDERDDAAWTEFVEIYQPLVYRLVRRSGLQDADAREIAQEVLMAVAGAIDRWQPSVGKGSFRAWLFRIARNLMINFLVKQRRQPRGSGDTDMQRLLEERTVTSPEESRLFEEEYRRQVFRWAAARIRTQFKDSTWQAFWRTCVDGQSVKQAGSELKMSAGAVYVARSRVMARLKVEIQKFEAE